MTKSVHKDMIDGLRVACENEQIICIIAEDEFAKLLRSNGIDAMTIDDAIPNFKVGV